ncbi:unnamed protein product [Anisakis simplex]|nr:unnamed protein product [Anisakis simplex]
MESHRARTPADGPFSAKSNTMTRGRPTETFRQDSNMGMNTVRAPSMVEDLLTANSRPFNAGDEVERPHHRRRRRKRIEV